MRGRHQGVAWNLGYVRTTKLVFSVLERVGRDGPCAAVAFFFVLQVLCACRGSRGC
jgi:hypothetical protein